MADAPRARLSTAPAAEIACPPCPADVTGLILAGGEGRRLGGVDKGLVDLDGQPLVAHVHARFTPQVGTLWISANRNQSVYAAWAGTVLSDAPSVAGSLGPLAGVATALAAMRTPWLATVACDMPWLPPDLVARLGAAVSPAHPLAVARAAGRMQPVCLLAHRTLAPHLAAYLAAGGRRVGAWLAQANAVGVDFDDAAAFGNVNTPDELVQAQRSQSSKA